MHLLIYYEDVDQLHERHDLRVVRTGPVCCEPRHRRVEASSVGLFHAEGGHFERYL